MESDGSGEEADDSVFDTFELWDSYSEHFLIEVHMVLNSIGPDFDKCFEVTNSQI
jgi:hypothetical protein